jgi:hypothetical protein
LRLSNPIANVSARPGAATRAERLAREAAHRRMVELRVAIRREAEAIVRKQIAARGEKPSHYLPKDITRFAQVLITSAWVAQAKERIAERNSRYLSKSQGPAAQALSVNEHHAQNGAAK